MRNRVTRVIREARKGYEDQIARHGRQGPRRIHRYNRSQLKIKPMIASFETGAGQMTGSDTETAEVLNVIFQSAYVTASTEDMPELPDSNPKSCKEINMLHP